MIENKNDASRNLEKALQALEQAKQRVDNEKKKQPQRPQQADQHFIQEQEKGAQAESRVVSCGEHS